MNLKNLIHFQRFANSLAYLLLIYLFCIVISSCKGDINAPIAEIPVEIQLSSEINNAKLWFEQYQTNKSKKASLDGNDDIKTDYTRITPLWNYAIHYGNSVEVPFLIGDKLIVPSIQGKLKGMGKQRLLIVRTPTESKGFVVNIMPEKKYTGKMKDVNLSNYKEKKFDGGITVRDLTGKAIAGYLIEKGEAIKKLKNASTLSGLTTRGWECIYTEYPCHCGRVCIGGDCGELQCETCWDEDCWYEEEDSNPEDDLNGGCYDPFCGGDLGGSGDSWSNNSDDDNCTQNMGSNYSSQNLGMKTYLPYARIEYILHISNVNIYTGAYSSYLQKNITQLQLPVLVKFENESYYATNNEMFDCQRFFSFVHLGNVELSQGGFGLTTNYEFKSNWVF